MKLKLCYNSLYFSDMLKKLPQDFSHRSFFFFNLYAKFLIQFLTIFQILQRLNTIFLPLFLVFSLLLNLALLPLLLPVFLFFHLHILDLHTCTCFYLLYTLMQTAKSFITFLWKSTFITLSNIMKKIH